MPCVEFVDRGTKRRKRGTLADLGRGVRGSYPPPFPSTSKIGWTHFSYTPIVFSFPALLLNISGASPF